MGAWWWEVWWGLWLALGWAVLGTAVSLAGWHLGRRVRQKTHGRNCLSLSLSRLGVAFYSACVLLSPSGPARLHSLRALVAWLQHPAFRAGYVYGAGMPDALPDALAVCVLEGGPEAAPLLDAVWDVYQSTRLTAAGRERLFTEAFLGRLRAFFLDSEDPACQRAALRLHCLLSCELLEAKWAAELPEALLPQLVWSRPGAPPVERHQLHLLRSQVARNQAFLRHPDFVDSLRGRLRGGDPGGLVLHARSIYRQDASEVELGPLFGPGCYTSIGSAFLFMPVLRDLLLNYDRLSKGDYRWTFRLCPTLRPTEAVAVMEGCVVPLLGRAEELPPAGLRFLLELFPTHMDYEPHSALTPPLDPHVAAAGVALGRRLRGLHFAAVQSALASGRLTDAQHWALIGGLCGGLHDPHFPHRYVDCPELCRLLLRDTLRLPLTRESQPDALNTLFGMIHLGELWASLAWGGGFVVLRRLIDLYQPPYKTLFGHLSIDGYVCQLLTLAGNLFQAHVPGVVFGAPLEPAEVARRLLAWRDSGLSAALRRLIDRQPPPGAPDLRDMARDLLQLHDDLLHHHPLQTLSHLPHEIHFPDN